MSTENTFRTYQVFQEPEDAQVLIDFLEQNEKRNHWKKLLQLNRYH